MLYLCADPSAAQPAPLSQCLDTILLSPDAGACFDYLEEQGLLLGNGGFLLTLLCPREGLVLPGQESFCADVARLFGHIFPSDMPWYLSLAEMCTVCWPFRGCALKSPSLPRPPKD